jgi:hypothetical protein
MMYLRLVSGCRLFAAAGSFGASNKNAIDDIAALLKRYTEDLLKELRAAEGERRVIADQFFTLVTNMTELIFSAEEAEVLRRRGRAASPAVAA